MDKSSRSPGERWAEVRADGRLIRYRSLGAGRPVLVLGAPGQGAPLGAAWDAWIEGLAASFRVVVPEASDTDGDLSAWLGCFLEGLGSRGVGIVAAGPFREAALELAALEPDRIARVVLMDAGSLGPAVREGRGGDDGRADVAVLKLTAEAEGPTSRLARLVAFLAGEGAAPPA